jgi:hypothetical protein
MIIEQNVAAQVLALHDLDLSEKFMLNIFWRTCWKGSPKSAEVRLLRQTGNLKMVQKLPRHSRRRAKRMCWTTIGGKSWRRWGWRAGQRAKQRRQCAAADMAAALIFFES